MSIDDLPPEAHLSSDPTAMVIGRNAGRDLWLAVNAELRDDESFVTRAGVAAGAASSAGAVARPAAAAVLSGADSARAGVASAAGVVVASVVVSVVVDSAAAEVASSDAFICANLSPATAVNVAPCRLLDSRSRHCGIPSAAQAITPPLGEDLEGHVLVRFPGRDRVPGVSRPAALQRERALGLCSSI